MADTVTKTFGVGGRTITVSLLRTLDASGGDYTAADVMSDDDTTSGGTAMSFTGIGESEGAAGYITKASILCSTTALTAKLTLFLFSATPTCELDDNAANTAVLAADQANYIGHINFPAMEDLGTGMSHTLAMPNQVVNTLITSNLPLAFNCASDSNTLYGVLVTRDGITGEDASMTVRINLASEQEL